MQSRNGYFKLEMRDEGTFLKIYPPEANGRLVDIKEVLKYLDTRNYLKFDLKEVNRAVNSIEAAPEIYVGEWNGAYENETMEITISSDKMLVFCRFYPPSNKGKLLKAEDILGELELQKVTVGIDQGQIQDFMQSRQYCTSYIFAKGIPPVPGKDASIEYFFNTNHNLKPKKNKDGTVDYRDLNTISRVEKGTLLAKLHKEEKGQPGKDVFGGDISVKQEKNLKLDFSNNITISEDKTELYSEVTGHASLVNGKVFVADVFEVPADVDNGTGNIVYDGNVSIKGNVKSGFSVTAKGNIVVEGVIEGAFISAGGQIVVKRGIHGMNKGHVEAESNIITQFIENATVVSGGFVEAGSILHSQVSAVSDIRVNGKKGFVTGGVIRAGCTVEAQTIGSEMGTMTKIEVGVDPQVKERYTDLQNEILLISKEMEQIKPALANFTEKMAKKETVNPERVKQIQVLAHNFKEKQQSIIQKREEFAKLHELFHLSTSAKVKVSGNIYPGVSIAISEVSMNIKSVTAYSKFIKEQGEIVVRPL